MKSINKLQKKKLDNKHKLRIYKEWERYLNEISHTQTVSQQAIYTRFFWLSIARGIKEIKLSYVDIKKLCNIKADTTIGNNIVKLSKLRHIKVLRRGFNIKTKYRIYTPREILTPDKYDLPVRKLTQTDKKKKK